jgi:hypothetical protein
MASSHGSNRLYLKGLISQLREVPRVAAAEVAVRVFTGVLQYTAIDSGQAVMNWRMQPYKGAPGSNGFDQHTMYWGFGETTPVAPAGYKWSKGATEDAVLMDRYQYAMTTKASLEGQDFDGIAIYNPTIPGYPGYAPGDSTRYYENALGDVEANLARILDQAFDEGYRATAARFHFVRYG